MRVEGQIEVGEAASYAGRACAPFRGGPLMLATLLGVTSGIFGVAYLLFTGADVLVGFPEEIVRLAPYFIGLGAFVGGWNVARSFALRRARKAYADRGLVSPVATSFETTDAGLTVVTGRLTVHAPWSALGDLFPAGPYWVALLEGSPQFLPRRFFGSPTEERAFIGALVAGMSPEARARSSEAVTFATTQNSL